MATDLDFDFPRTKATPATYRPGPHWVAFLAACFTWPLLFVGGLVTTYRVGMAVPDWPTTFGQNMFTYNMFDAPWAVFGEHSHRLYGAAVGIATILLMIDFLAFDRRPWMKWLGVTALLAVIAQGLLGGLRVRLNSTAIAAVHGVTAQLFFGFMVGLVVMTGRGWFAPTRMVAHAGKYQRLAASFLGLVVGQIAVGAYLRHYNDRAALGAHWLLAVLVLGHGAATVARVLRDRVAELVPAARALAVLLVAQIALGVGAWWLLRPYDGTVRAVTRTAALVRTGHQANAGLLVAAAVVVTLRAFGQLRSPDAPSRAELVATGTSGREAVA